MNTLIILIINNLPGEQFSKVRQLHYSLSGDDIMASTSSHCDSGAALLCRTSNVKIVPKNIFVSPSKRFDFFEDSFALIN